MTSAIKRWFQEIIIERAKQLLWANVAAEVEADAVLDYVAQIARIEEQADAYEADGKTHLAEILRERAAQISFENPAGAGERIVRSLSALKAEFSLISHQPSRPSTDEIPQKPRRGRPPKQQPASGPASSQETAQLDAGHDGRNDREGTYVR